MALVLYQGGQDNSTGATATTASTGKSSAGEALVLEQIRTRIEALQSNVRLSPYIGL